MAYSIGSLDTSHSENILQDIGFIGFWDCDFVDGVVQASPEFYQFYGVSPRDRSTLRFDDFIARVHPDDVPLASVDHLQLIGPDGIREVEYRVIDPEGRTRWVFCRAAFKLDTAGRLLSGRGVAFDVTASKRAERARRPGADARDSKKERIATLLIEALRLSKREGEPSLIHAISLSLIMVGKGLSRALVETARGRPN